MGTQRHRIDPKEICFCGTKKEIRVYPSFERLRGVPPGFKSKTPRGPRPRYKVFTHTRHSVKRKLMPRPQKSAEVKAKTGVHSRPNRAVMQVNGVLPVAPPPGLTKDARAAWEMAVQFSPKGHLTAVDHALLERWCRSYALYRKLQKTVDHDGVLSPDDPGKMLPQFVALMKIQSQMLAIEKELGFTPVSRARVTVPQQESKDNDFDDFS